MSERKERCETCKFWEMLPSGEQEESSLTDDEGSIGLCKRYPPLANNENPTASEWEEFVNPTVVSFDWCGEWLDKNKG